MAKTMGNLHLSRGDFSVENCIVCGCTHSCVRFGNIMNAKYRPNVFRDFIGVCPNTGEELKLQEQKVVAVHDE